MSKVPKLLQITKRVQVTMHILPGIFLNEVRGSATDAEGILSCNGWTATVSQLCIPSLTPLSVAGCKGSTATASCPLDIISITGSTVDSRTHNQW